MRINSLPNGPVSAHTAPDAHYPARVERLHPVRTMAYATVVPVPVGNVLADLVPTVLRVLDNVIATEASATIQQLVMGDVFHASPNFMVLRATKRVSVTWTTL